MTKTEPKKTPGEGDKKEYEVISGSYTTYVDTGKSDSKGKPVIEREKLRTGETVMLTEDVAKKLIGIVRPVNYTPPKAAEAPKGVFAPGEVLKPINEIGAGQPQEGKTGDGEPEDGKTDAVLEAAANAKDGAPASAPGTKQVPAGKDEGKKA